MYSRNKLKKIEIRSEVIRAINSKEIIEVKNRSDLILKNLVCSDLWRNADIVFTYLSIDNEVETVEIVKCAVINDKKVAVPRIVGKKLVFFLISDHVTFDFATCNMSSIYEILNTDKYDKDDRLPGDSILSSSYIDPYHERHFEFNQFNILEPKIHLPVIYFENLKNYSILLIVPGIAFTKEKYRLGRGGGYYDRTIHELREHELKSLSAVGIFFEEQLVKELPLDSWDEKLDNIVTEKNIY